MEFAEVFRHLRVQSLSHCHVTWRCQAINSFRGLTSSVIKPLKRKADASRAGVYTFSNLDHLFISIFEIKYWKKDVMRCKRASNLPTIHQPSTWKRVPYEELTHISAQQFPYTSNNLKNWTFLGEETAIDKEGTKLVWRLEHVQTNSRSVLRRLNNKILIKKDYGFH